MDKNKTIGVLLLLVAVGCIFYFAPPAQPTPPVAPPASASASSGNAGAAATTAALTPEPATAAGQPPAMIAAVAHDHADATVTTLSNNYLTVRLTDFGGAVLDVAFTHKVDGQLQYPAVQGQPEPYVFNIQHAAPILAFTDYPGLDQNTHYKLVSADATKVVYQAVVEGRIEVTRTYTLPAGDGDATHDPYRLRHETTFRNLNDKPPGALAALTALSLGTAAPVGVRDFGLYLNVARFDGADASRTDRTKLAGGGMLAALGLTSNPPKSEVADEGVTVWGAVKNQFFASIYTPDADQPGTAVVTRRVELTPFPGTSTPNTGITGAMQLKVPALAPGGSTTLKGDLYVGPKEYIRLSKFAHREDKVMQFDGSLYYRIFLTGYVAPFMNWMMNIMHQVIGNWGLAIILMTLTFKTVSLPLTLSAARSGKRMQKLQPLMKALREKYKDNPQKQNEAVMNLFKEHKVNPVGGCLPVLLTMPLFVGFFNMLQGTAELRFQGFLWEHDLSAPDTVGHIGGFPINIFPLLMGATMFYQMRLTPQPTMDSSQSPQMMMKFMPFMITAICYNFSCALAVYSTTNGLFTIVQQTLVNKYAKVDDVVATTGPGGRPVKNVTPGRKKN